MIVVLEDAYAKKEVKPDGTVCEGVFKVRLAVAGTLIDTDSYLAISFRIYFSFVFCIEQRRRSVSRSMDFAVETRALCLPINFDHFNIH